MTPLQSGVMAADDEVRPRLPRKALEIFHPLFLGSGEESVHSLPHHVAVHADRRSPLADLLHELVARLTVCPGALRQWHDANMHALQQIGFPRFRPRLSLHISKRPERIGGDQE